MKGFTLLWSKILDSSIWMETKETRLVWITMLAMKDADGMVHAARTALAYRARVSEKECAEALKVLMAPDPHSTTADNEGRRIVEIPGGWQILNNDLYRFSTEAKREFWKQQKAEQRQRLKNGKPLVGEESTLRRLKKGQISQEHADNIAASTREKRESKS